LQKSETRTVFPAKTTNDFDVAAHDPVITWRYSPDLHLQTKWPFWRAGIFQPIRTNSIAFKNLWLAGKKPDLQNSHLFL